MREESSGARWLNSRRSPATLSRSWKGAHAKVHIHCFHLRQAYEAGWLGVFSVSTPMMEAMAKKRPRELPDPRQYLADRASQAAASAASSSRSAGHDD